jgi:predicted RNase H-like nuclease
LNHQKALNNKKKTSAGLLERLSILSSYFTHLEEVYHQVLADTRRSDIQKDDILDSMVLAVAALLSQEKNQHVITDANSADRLDVPIGIYYYQPTTTSL